MEHLKKCEQLKSADFPKLTRIHDEVFKGCHQLESVDFPKLTTIHTYNTPYTAYTGWGEFRGGVFRGCRQLKSANLPILNDIEMFMFTQSGLQSIHAPRTKRIRDGAFRHCNQLQSLDFPECRDIHKDAFRSCLSLKSACFPECKNICRDAFRNCVQLSSVFVPKVTRIDEECFSGSTNLELLVVSDDLIDQHDPKSDEAWWKQRGINPQTTKITSFGIWIDEQDEERISPTVLITHCY